MLDPVGAEAEGKGQSEEPRDCVPTAAATNRRTEGRRAASRGAAENLGRGESDTLTPTHLN